MHNVTGNPVEGDDFFDRAKELAQLQREIRNSNNILLSAPRRVGKTSLVLKLCALERLSGRTSVFINVEGCSDELAFAERLVDGLKHAGLNPQFLDRVSLGFGRLRQALRGMKLGAGIDLEMGDAADPDHSTLGRALESVFHKIDTEAQPVLLAIDEMPEFLLQLGRQDHGNERVSRFLHWLRSLRQTHPRHLRWIFLGSIGLDSFVDDRGLRKTINDLTPLTMGALGRDEADAFLAKLGDDNGLPIPADIRALIIERIGWPLPHHLQLLFHALVDSDATRADAASVDTAFENLLRPGMIGQFDTWRQRLDEQFSIEDAGAAKIILKHLCKHPKGRTRDQILNALMTPHADAGEVEDRLASLLQVLLRDGYLLEETGRYAFRSFLLREFWNRREIR